MDPGKGRRVDVSQILWGGFVLFLGVVLSLEKLDLLEFWRNYWRYFPLVLIVVGFTRLLAPSQKLPRSEGLWLLLIGFWLQANTLGILRFRKSWPLLLVIVGAMIVWQTLASGGGKKTASEDGNGN